MRPTDNLIRIVNSVIDIRTVAYNNVHSAYGNSKKRAACKDVRFDWAFILLTAKSMQRYIDVLVGLTFITCTTCSVSGCVFVHRGKNLVMKSHNKVKVISLCKWPTYGAIYVLQYAKSRLSCLNLFWLHHFKLRTMTLYTVLYVLLIIGYIWSYLLSSF